jgi:hypothetical protein
MGVIYGSFPHNTPPGTFCPTDRIAAANRNRNPDLVKVWQNKSLNVLFFCFIAIEVNP